MQTVKFYQTSIGKKILMAVSGIFMCLFLVGHLSGNLLMYASKDAFNAYANFLSSAGFTVVIEMVLILILIVHVVTAVQLSMENRAAGTGKYAIKASGGKRTWASSHMLHSGVIILIFLIIHIVTFKYGGWSESSADNTLYDLVVRRFGDWYYSLFYAVSMIFLGFHLHHAIKSACITLGIVNSELLHTISKISLIFSVVVSIGFISFPGIFFIQSLTP